MTTAAERQSSTYWEEPSGQAAMQTRLPARSARIQAVGALDSSTVAMVYTDLAVIASGSVLAESAAADLCVRLANL